MIKQGVKILGIKPELLLGLFILRDVFCSQQVPLIITSCTDGVHSQNSKHYLGMAVDIRSRNVPSDTIKEIILKTGQVSLGHSFLFILEDKGDDNEHYHLQFNG